MHWFFLVLKKYTVFSGRAGRKEFWYFILFYYIFYFLLVIAGTLIEKAISPESGLLIIQIIYAIYMLGTLLPLIAVTVRRLHDTGRCGWWILLEFIPIIGWIVLLVFMILESEPGENIYGPPPLTEN